ncbi:MAG: CBS domain-containing protein [Methanomicrobiales archaeon]|nr:CBS domain-containing protein [Methanomicrobiales archaeon]
MKVARDLLIEIPVLRHTEYITKARQILRDEIFREIYVVTEKNGLLGYIDATDVLRVTETKSNVTVEGYVKEASAVLPDTSLEDVARAVRTMGTDSAPVIDENGSLLGAIMLSGLFPILIRRQELRGKVLDRMERRVVSCNPGDTINKIYSLIVESGYCAFPVVRNRALIGMLSRSDILRNGRIRKTLDNASKVTVESVMTTPALSISPDDDIEKAAEMLAGYDVSRLPVVADGMLVGIIDRHDVLKALSL